VGQGGEGNEKEREGISHGFSFLGLDGSASPLRKPELRSCCCCCCEYAVKNDFKCNKRIYVTVK
jgi:hypothetical protein